MACCGRSSFTPKSVPAAKPAAVAPNAQPAHGSPQPTTLSTSTATKRTTV